MKRIFTLLLVFTVAFAFAQKNADNVTVEQTHSFVISKVDDLDLLLPGNWENATGAVTFSWAEGNGYIFGTNTYGDQAYGQIFLIDEDYTIGGAVYWIGARNGTEGEVVFTLWDYSTGSVGDVLASKTMAMADINASETLGDALIVTFDEPVTVTGDFVIGADITGLNAFVEGTYGLGNVSSQDGDGAGAALAIVRETTGWGDVLAYDVDVDIAIFPFLVEAGDVDTYTVTFNVDMTDVDGFDPAEDKVFLTGSLTGWAEPGTENSIELTRKVDVKSSFITVFEEDFSGWEAGDDFSDSDWTTYDEDGDGYNWFIFETNNYGMVATSASYVSVNDTPTPLTPENWLVSPAIDLTDYDGEEVIMEWRVFAQDVNWPQEHYKLVISTTDNLVASFPDENIVYEETIGDDIYERSVDISDYAGEVIYFAFVHYDCTDWFRINIDNIAIKVAQEVDEVIFTATVEGVEAGELQYKYFSDAFGAGWDGGEWAGDPNRSVIISGDVTLDDVWGDQPSSIVDNQLAEQGINLFPNPVRNTLYIENSERINQVRIFDLTGRMVYSQAVNDNATSVNVSEFTKGVYIMQVMSVNGVTSRKFNVVK